MIQLMPTQLTALKIAEISGVDSPANLEEGWAVIKSKLTPEQLAQVDAAMSQVETAHGQVAEALEAVAPFLDPDDDEVKAAVATLTEYCKSVVNPAPEPEDSVLEKLADALRSVFKRGRPTGDSVDELRKAVQEALALKQTLVWGEGETYESVREGVCHALMEMYPNGNGRWSYVQDVDVAQSQALVCSYEDGEGEETYVVPFTRDADGMVTVAPKTEWIKARRAWVLDTDEE